MLHDWSDRNKYSDQAPAIPDQYLLNFTLPRFRCRYFDLGHMTLQLSSKYILKLYLHAENDIAKSSHSIGIVWA